MKLKKLLLFILTVTLYGGVTFAQQTDTVYVPANKSDGTPYVNSLIDYIVADTNATGEQLHSVYKLDRGNFYIVDKAVDLKNPVKIVADPPVENDPTKVPPKILSNVTADGGTSTMNLINTWADITIKNVWLAGIDAGGQNRGWGFGQALAVQDSFVTVTLDGVWLDYNGWSAIATAQPHTSWFINNLHARNEQNPGDQWTTFVFFFEQAGVVDTFVAKNCTYFQSNSFFIFPPDVVQYIEVDHCTFVNLLKWPFHETQWLKAKFTNNIFYNVSALSLTEKEEEGQDPDHLEYGLINVDTLAANELGEPGEYTIPESEREIIVKNNLYYFTQDLQEYWANNDSVKAQLWMNSRTRAMFDNDAEWPGLVEENTWNQDPMFNDFPALSEATAKLVQVCKDIRAGSTHEWDWDADQVSDPQFYRLINPYPLPENFKSYAGLLGTDGLPIGDLNYYPELVSVEENTQSVPNDFQLLQNYPNPFNPSTIIRFNLNKSGYVKLSVFNLLGERIITLVDDVKNAGSHFVTWNGRNSAGLNVPAGIYFYKLEMENNIQVKKMTLLK